MADRTALIDAVTSETGIVPSVLRHAFESKAMAEHDRQVARAALLAEADAIESYTLNHASAEAILDHVLWLIRRDAGTEPIHSERSADA